MIPFGQMKQESVKGAAVVSSFFMGLSKATGYLRALAVAYLFGTYAGLDSFYVTLGILSLFTMTTGTVLESTLLPRLIQGDKEKMISLFVIVCRVSLFLVIVFVGIVILFPSQIVLLFAHNFDAQRLQYASGMFIWLLPWTLCTVCQNFLAVWCNFQGRYSLVSKIQSLWNFAAIPLLFFFKERLGVFSVPLAYSVSYVIVTFMMLLYIHNFPLRNRCRLSKDIMIPFLSDCLLSAAIIGAGTLYSMTDRYFGSSLPAGNISAMYYAAQIYSIPIGVLAPALMIYLGKASEEVGRDVTAAEGQLEMVLKLGWLYVCPVALFLMVLAKPVVHLALGYGAFDAAAVNLTTPCLRVSALMMPFLLLEEILVRYARAISKLKSILLVTVIGLLANVFLDWLFVKPWGAAGLCAATGLTWGGSSLFYVWILAPRKIETLVRNMFLSFGFCGVCAMPLIIALSFGFGKNYAILFLLSCLGIMAYFLGGERSHLFDSIRNDLRPKEFFSIAGKWVLKKFVGKRL